MQTLRKDKGCWAQVRDDYCPNNAVFGSLYCEEHADLKETRREKLNRIMSYEHTHGLLANK